ACGGDRLDAVGIHVLRAGGAAPGIRTVGTDDAARLRPHARRTDSGHTRGHIEGRPVHAPGAPGRPELVRGAEGTRPVEVTGHAPRRLTPAAPPPSRTAPPARPGT